MSGQLKAKGHVRALRDGPSWVRGCSGDSKRGRRLALTCDLSSEDSTGGLAPANNVSNIDEGRILIIKSMEINGKTYEAGGLNILVGKNNSGKSTLLKELCATSQTTVKNAVGNKWVDGVTITTGQIKTLMDLLFSNPGGLCEVDGMAASDAFLVLKPRMIDIAAQARSNVFHGSHLASIASSPLYCYNEDIEARLSPNAEIESSSEAADYIVKYTVNLAASVRVRSEFCDARLSESFETRVENIELMERSPADQTAKLFCSPTALESLNTVLDKVFGFQVGFDTIRQAQAFLRIMPQGAEQMVFANEIEKSHWWEKNAPKIAEQGDGIKAFLKLLMSIRDDFASVIFIDEPETFLHPPQRRAIGEAIVSAVDCGKQIFVATHDADVVRGMLTGDISPNVLYLNDTNGERTVERIGLSSLVDCGLSKVTAKHGVQMMNEKVINSLFFDKAVLVENENDRLIYEHFCQQRLYAEYQGRCFLGLNGSDAVLNLFDLMVAAGMTVCCVVDIDFLLSDELGSKRVNALDPSLREQHVAFARKMHSLGDYREKKKKMKTQGVVALEGDLFDDAKCLIESYAKYGVHIVPAGELESWFSAPGKNGISLMVSQIQDEMMDFAELTSFMEKVIA